MVSSLLTFSSAPGAHSTPVPFPVPLPHIDLQDRSHTYRVRPLLPLLQPIWFHAGALFYGDKKTLFPCWLAEEAREKGWTVLSADYRLLPESKIDEVMQDVRDLWE
jgi:acetyl esterase/lipase